MKLIDGSLKNPYLVLIVCAAVSLAGLYAFFFMPTDLFPDTVPQQVVVITSWPGASRQEVENNITRLMEPELKAARRLKEISSITRDEISSISLEFFYDRSSEAAATEITNLIERIRGRLPEGARAPQIHRLTNVTSPVMTIGLSPKENSIKKLRDIKLLASNDIRNILLNVEGVNEVEVFGGFEPQVRIAVNRRSLESYNISLSGVLTALQSENVSLPGGYITTTSQEYIVKSERVFRNINDVKNTTIGRQNSGLIRLKDVAKIKYGHDENRSFYRGNGRRAIALNILRSKESAAVDTINNAKTELKKLQQQFKDIKFEITTDQSPIINVNIRGMNWSLISAIIMTCLVVFLFLANWRSALVMAVAIPLSFLASFALLNFTPWTLNMVTLSGLIISTGMVVDAAVIVVENIMRHYEHEDITLNEAVRTGSGEVALDIFAGMMTTVIVLIPIMFVGGYPQRVLRPLSVVISSTLFASWLAAAAVIPLVLKNWLKPKKTRNKLEKIVEDSYEKIDTPLQNYYLSMLKSGLRHKKKVLFLLLLLTAIITLVTVSFVGRELMPPMDTGILHISFETAPSASIEKVNSIARRMENSIARDPNVEEISTVDGSEAGQISFGRGGQTSQQVILEITLIPRNKRNKDIWQYVSEWRQEFSKYPELIKLEVKEYGATPVATTQAPLHLTLSSENDRLLLDFARDIKNEIKDVRGLFDVQQNWDLIKTEHNFVPRDWKTRIYGINSAKVAELINLSVSGAKSGNLRLESYLDIPVHLYYDYLNHLKQPSDLLSVPVNTPKGIIPLRSLVSYEKSRTKTLSSRRNLKNTIEVSAVNQGRRLSHVNSEMEQIVNNLKDKIPFKIKTETTGTMADMADTFSRVGLALMIGLVFLYLFLVIVFKSWLHPLVILSIIPFSLIGAFLALLIFNKPMCMPAMMGLILMNGTVVNDAILMLTFILEDRKKGASINEATSNAVRLRMRPILMTTVSTVIGFTPLIFEWAVGLERMSPLGIVAAGGLIVGTFLTLVVVPLVYSLLEEITVSDTT